MIFQSQVPETREDRGMSSLFGDASFESSGMCFHLEYSQSSGSWEEAELSGKGRLKATLKRVNVE